MVIAKIVVSFKLCLGKTFFAEIDGKIKFYLYHTHLSKKTMDEIQIVMAKRQTNSK